MKSLRSFLFCALALSFVPQVVLADEPSLTEWAQRRVQSGLVKPLAERESNRPSRARPAPRERQVRITQTTTSADKKGQAFVPFAVDVRWGGEWHQGDIVGCVYRSTGSLFVKRGDEYRPAEFLLGKNVQPVAGVCEAAPAPAA